ncbi:thiol reductant ABC exporter subunit CydC [Sinomonas halotolerans]|uniref:Thiol reductant ABC exporter subunit CydC n=1 Tax=Sinomonas halotolerans TaxID=1644133 RepID=A0ABU9X2G7_9MICC
MRPDIPLGPTTRWAAALLALLAVARAAGLVLMAQGVADGLAGLAAGSGPFPGPGGAGALPGREAALSAAAGVLIRAAAHWGAAAVGRWAAVGVKEELRSRLLAAGLAGGASPSGASPSGEDDGEARVSSSAAATAVLAGRGLDGLDSLYTQYLPALVHTAAVPLLLGARILGADWVSALILALTLPLVPLFMILIGRHTLEAVAEAQQSLFRLSAHLVELAQGLPVLVGLGRAGEQRAALADLSRGYRDRTMATLRVAFLSALALELIATISVAVVAVFIGVRLVHGDMPLAPGLLALMLAPECFQPLRDLGTAHHASEDGAEALRRVRERLAVPSGTSAVRGSIAAGASTSGSAGTAGGMRVGELTVRYDGAAHDAVAGVAFTALAGRRTLLAGPSGSGKTTVLAVLAGLTRDGAGARVTGTVSGIDPARVAWVPQHPQFTERSVTAEVALYAGEAGRRPGTVAELLDRLGLGALGHADPAELSPGQQRRVAVARGLARVADGADTVLLDEPTAHLDEASAALVEQAIVGLPADATVLLVSHETGTAALADYVIDVSTRAGAGRSGVESSRFRADIPDAVAPPLRESRREDAPSGAWLGALARLIRPDAGRYALAALAGLGAAAAGVALAALSGWLIVRASEQPPILFLLTAIVGVRFFGIARAVLRYCERLAVHSAVLSTLTELRGKLWAALAAQGLAARRLLVPGAALESLVGDAEAVRDQLPRVLHPIATAVLVAAGALVAVGLLLPEQVPALAAALGTALLVAPAVALAADRHSARLAATGRTGLLARIGQAFGAAGDLAANGRTGVVLAGLRAEDARLTRLERRSAGAEGLAQGLVLAASGFAAVATLATADAAGAPGTTAAAVLLLQLALAEPLAAASTAVQQLPALRSALARIAAEDSPSPVSDTVPAPGAEPGAFLEPGEGTGVRPGAVRLRGVALGWPGAADVVTRLTLEASPGEWVVVAGPSGSGKSTLLALLTGFLAPRAGTAAVGGTVAWCPQEGHLFDSTVRGNLALARGRDRAPSDAELEEALRKVGLLEHVRSLPGGLDARIGSRGAYLSGGQRQRLAVARTLLAGADVVLLDEPTAHLDPEAGLDLVAALHAALADRTVIMVTHHASELLPGDRLVRLEGALDGGRAPQPVG